MIDIKQLNFAKLNGLMPAIIIDCNTSQVLMLGFMNEEALKKTIDSKRVTFFSRTQNKFWTKGETSGNFLELVSIKPDCDNDTLLVEVNPVGNTCHTGSYSCFNIEKDNTQFLSLLYNLVQKRKSEMPEKSYTTSLFKEGADRIIQKLGEESIETIIAAKNRNREEVINETADLIYHLFVMLAEQNISLNDVVEKLESRHHKKS
ncbi:MAG: bifunctional phosphoribosyl-AMP cyclohydrolase/phosphoribosyl-ATP diphosphatase HisIE [Ignavibacteria bacterium]|nr:bifunctional phosphoribosyl-AMP cyclohydrolase/phosphoribosyl-ATP diphosphatase HisIE [Ignavibacteria bacterium]